MSNPILLEAHQNSNGVDTFYSPQSTLGLPSCPLVKRDESLNAEENRIVLNSLKLCEKIS